MRSAIVYYSYSGNTRKVALELRKYLQHKGYVELIEIKALDESDNFFGQGNRAFFRKQAKIEDTKFNLSEFDVIYFGTPVWAFAPAPATNAFLNKCFGLENKSVVIFTTYGSGLGNNRCIKIMRDILKQKGAKQFRSFSVQQFKVDDSEFVLDVLGGVM